MPSARDKQRAMQALDADLQADDISIEDYSRESARIAAGSSRSVYLRSVTTGIHARAAAGDGAALATLGLRYGIVAVLLLVLLIGGCVALDVATPNFDPSSFDGDSD